MLSLNLQQLQQAVEKRNEIIARLSSNLQEALASRDQMQLEAQSLTGQIQALQKQLQQVSATLSFICGSIRLLLRKAPSLTEFAYFLNCFFLTDQCRVSTH